MIGKGEKFTEWVLFVSKRLRRTCTGHATRDADKDQEIAGDPLRDKGEMLDTYLLTHAKAGLQQIFLMLCMDALTCVQILIRILALWAQRAIMR